MAVLQAQHRQGDFSPIAQIAKALKLHRFCVASDADQTSAVGMASMAAGPVSAITQYTGHCFTICAITRKLHTLNKYLKSVKDNSSKSMSREPVPFIIICQCAALHYKYAGQHSFIPMSCTDAENATNAEKEGPESDM